MDFQQNRVQLSDMLRPFVFCLRPSYRGEKQNNSGTSLINLGISLENGLLPVSFPTFLTADFTAMYFPDMPFEI